MSTRHDTVIFDVDGTLVDSTYLHALAWQRAFRRHDVSVETWRIHRAIGMGSDKLITAVAGDDVERRGGDELRDSQSEFYDEISNEVTAFDGALELIQSLRDRFTVAVASSGSKEDVEEALDIVGISEDDVAAIATSDDADESKPEPDIIKAAFEKSGGTSAIFVGDAVYDVSAAAKLGFPTVAVRTGGFGEEELRRAGAIHVVNDVKELLDADWDSFAQAEPPAGADEDPDEIS